MYASGSRSARNRCASVRASTASVFTRPEAIALVGPQGMREMQLAILVLEQLGQPLPAVGRLQRELRIGAELADQLAEHLLVVEQPPRHRLAAGLLDHGDLRALAVQVDSDVNHAWASFGPGTQRAPGDIALRSP